MKRKDLEEHIEEYLLEEQEDEKAKNTLIHYRHIINMFVSSLPDDEITKVDFMRFKEKMLEKYKPKTVSNYITIVNKFIKYVEMSMDESIQDFDFNRMKKYYSKQTLKNIKIQQEASLKEVLEPIDLKRMLRMAKKLEEWDLYYIMKVIAYTGVRAEELKIFTVENLESNYIKVKKQRKNKKRNCTTGFTKGFAEILQKCRNYYGLYIPRKEVWNNATQYDNLQAIKEVGWTMQRCKEVKSTRSFI